jgi:hypothetical protein
VPGNAIPSSSTETAPSCAGPESPGPARRRRLGLVTRRAESNTPPPRHGLSYIRTAPGPAPSPQGDIVCITGHTGTRPRGCLEGMMYGGCDSPSGQADDAAASAAVHRNCRCSCHSSAVAAQASFFQQKYSNRVPLCFTESRRKAQVDTHSQLPVADKSTLYGGTSDWNSNQAGQLPEI